MFLRAFDPFVAGRTVVTTEEGVQIGLGVDGSIQTLKHSGHDWASTEAPLAAYTYKTFNETEWKPFTCVDDL